MPKVSVIIPTYNRAKYITEAIESVLNQTYKDYEIIIVDDGSTDNTRSIIESIKDKRIKYSYFPHRGRPYARNEGLRQATGKYICFLDADDIMLPENLELKVNYAEEKRLKLMFSDYYTIYSNVDLTNIDNLTPYLKGVEYLRLIKENIPDFSKESLLHIFPKKYFLRVALKNIGVQTNTVFIDSYFLFNEAKAYFDLKFKFAQDVDMWCRLILHPSLEEIGYLDLPLAVYRYYNAQWDKSPEREYYLYLWTSRFTTDMRNYMKWIGRRYMAEELWNMSWWFKNREYRLHFFKKIFAIYPWKLKYCKSFLGLMLRRGIHA